MNNNNDDDDSDGVTPTHKKLTKNNQQTNNIFWFSSTSDIHTLNTRFRNLFAVKWNWNTVQSLSAVMSLIKSWNTTTVHFQMTSSDEQQWKSYKCI